MKALWLAGLLALPAAAAPDVHLVYMGGNDCPPCVAWRREELPQLQASAVWPRVRFSHVNKVITSAVPPTLFLPDAVKPLKDKLDHASNRITGSPQSAIVVDGEVVDYWFGARPAADLVEALTALAEGRPYPLSRCLRLETARRCAQSVPAGR